MHGCAGREQKSLLPILQREEATLRLGLKEPPRPHREISVAAKRSPENLALCPLPSSSAQILVDSSLLVLVRVGHSL